jgi:anti-sigma B factor antagonist
MPTEPRLTLETTIQKDAVQGDAAIVRCTGKLTSGVTEILYDEIKRLIPNYKWVVLDLTNLTQMDSMGLGTVVRLYVSARSGGSSLQLINLSRRVRELLGITNLLHVFEVFGEERVRF